MIWRERHVIDAFKIATGPYVLACMAAFHRWGSSAAWLYLGLHGTYGVLWVAKSRIFPDRGWERPLRPGRAAVLVLGLASYWLAPTLLLARGREAPPPLLGACVAMFGVGVFLHFAADMQKHVELALRPGQLFTGGLWRRVRNPNYLGELLIYSSFAALSQRLAPFVVLAVAFAIEWLPNMRRKDRSLARFPEFAAYRARTALLVPWVL
ncbi:MAG TPA: DUF1295 domain-containing protein [Polyangia bacterium]|nr:DUF1295 domain-containing protein [Polyangia bacterium]